PKFTQQSYLDIAMSVYGLGWVFVFAAILIGLVIYFDLFAILAISSAWALSFLPIPTLWGRFGPNGSSLGWHQARELLRNQGQAQLFWIEERGVERVSAAVFQKLATESCAICNGRRSSWQPAGYTSAGRRTARRVSIRCRVTRYARCGVCSANRGRPRTSS